MKIEIKKYQLTKELLPGEGQYIIGHQTDEEIVVYQAYKASIAEYAVKHQVLGGSEFSYNRMSWIKPNFLWMMYRCGWAEKENQDRVLALWIRKAALEEILSNAVLSSFNPQYYTDKETWEMELEKKEVRLQWDPDHDPFGQKMTRRAIQLGLKGFILKDFGNHQISLIEDITGFVKEQKRHIDNGRLDLLEVPVEKGWDFKNEELKRRIGVDNG